MPLVRPLMRALLGDREGNVALLAGLMALPMTLAAGGAIDFALYEETRSRVQDALDRGVLAAASLNQPAPAREVVESYILKSIGGRPAVIEVEDERTANTRKVTASVAFPFETSFLALAGIETINVPAASQAEETRQNIEMSLILDISGSMYDNGGMVQLKPAAKSFIDTMLKPDLKAVTSISIVPFAGQVNLGREVFDHLVGPLYPRRHAQSSCFEMPDLAFDGATPLFPGLDQVPHFTYYNHNARGKEPWWCPTDSAAITYMTNDADRLKGAIEALKPFDGTGTAYAVKWGQLLLDPSMRTALAGVRTKGLRPIPAEFAGRPANFEDRETKKYLVLMTDGQIGFQPRPANPTTNEVTDKNISCTGCSREIYKGQVAGQYARICAYAKSKGITVFTIAFKISSNAVAADLAKCASHPTNAYRVDGLDISEAFRSIASKVQTIRLVG